jgi:alpha-glucosidase
MTMLLLALPGGTYMYQGEELGLPEVLDIQPKDMQDPSFFRNPEVGLSRDGCRVPLPWKTTGSSFGFGSNGSHLPMPSWYGEYSVEAEDGKADSFLEFYRHIVALRKKLQTKEDIQWIGHGFFSKVLHFARPNGWHSITNFGSKPVKLPAGKLLSSSTPLVDGKLPANATAWLLSTDQDVDAGDFIVIV